VRLAKKLGVSLRQSYARVKCNFSCLCPKVPSMR
jgi:hypothetical protein